MQRLADKVYCLLVVYCGVGRGKLQVHFIKAITISVSLDENYCFCSLAGLLLITNWGNSRDQYEIIGLDLARMISYFY